MAEQLKRLFEFGPFRLDPAEQRLTHNGEPIQITAKVFDLLLLFVERQGQLLEKEEIFREVWQDRLVSESNLTVNISALRRALSENEDGATYIETVPRRGYRFLPEVREIHDELAANPCEPQLSAATLATGQVRKRIGHQTAVLVGFVLAVLAIAIVFWIGSRGRVAEQQGVNTIAVLPFRHLNAETSDESLELGIADALIAKLGRVRRITVRPTRAVLKYAGQTCDPQSAGRELGVDAVLDGTVQRSNDGVKVTVQLVSVRDGRHLWSDTFHEQWTDGFSVEDSISNQVAQSLSIQLTAEDRDLLAKHFTTNVDAYDAYQKGRYFWNKRTPEGFRKAIQYFRQATAYDTNYALAYAGLADSYILLAIFGDLPPGEAAPKAEAAALKALELDQSLAEAHTSLAAIKWWYGKDVTGAEREFKRAIELNPNYPTAHHWYALYLSERRRHEEAFSEIDLAQQLDPLSTVISSDVALIFQAAGRFDEAIKQYRRTLEIDAGDELARRQLGNVYCEKGMFDEAIIEYQKVIQIHGEQPINLVALGSAYAASGRRHEAMGVLGRLKSLARQRYVPPFYIASLYVKLGKKDEAFKWVEKVFQEKGRFVDYMTKDFEDLQSDPRWAQLAGRYGGG